MCINDVGKFTHMFNVNSLLKMPVSETKTGIFIFKSL